MFKLLRKKPTKILLGRWAVDHSDEILKRKIDMANWDSCGSYSDKPIVKKANKRNTQRVYKLY